MVLVREKVNLTVETASAVIGFAQKLEELSSSFYRKMAEMYINDRETFLDFAKECEKDKILVARTYQETISDALEAGFSFRFLNLDDYLIDTTLTEDTCYKDALKKALEIEEKASRFYTDIAEQSRSLLATIPKALRKVAEVRGKRKLRLKSLLNGLK